MCGADKMTSDEEGIDFDDPLVEPTIQRPTIRWKAWIRTMTLPIFITLYWVGLWNLLDLYVLGTFTISRGYWWRDLGYIGLGMGGMVSLRWLWPLPVEDKVALFSRVLLMGSLGIIFWTGAWNVIDVGIIRTTVWREIIYVIIAVPVLGLLDIFCKEEGEEDLL